MTKKLHWWRHFSVFADVNTNDFCSVKYTWVTWGKSWRHQSTSFVLGYARCQFQTLQFGVSFSCFFLQTASGIMKTKLREGLSFCDKLPWWGGYFSPSPLLKHLCNSIFNQNISVKLVKFSSGNLATIHYPTREIRSEVFKFTSTLLKFYRSTFTFWWTF